MSSRGSIYYTGSLYGRVERLNEVVEPYGIKINSQELFDLEGTLGETADTEYRELLAMIPPAVKRKHMAEMKRGQTLDDVLSFSRDAFVRDVLFTKEGFGLKPIVFTPTTRKLGPDEQIPSVSTKQHLPYFDDHPFIPKLIKYQKIAKLRNTYVGLPEHEETVTNRTGEERTVTVGPTGFWKYLTSDDFIHPSFILHRTVTGRTASAAPNGQNFPKRGKLAKQYRKIFIARPGYTLIECDLSQAELRIAAWMANEQTMLDVYNSGGDIHMSTALVVSNLSPEAFALLSEEDRADYRQKAKAFERHSDAIG